MCQDFKLFAEIAAGHARRGFLNVQKLAERGPEQGRFSGVDRGIPEAVRAASLIRIRAAMRALGRTIVRPTGEHIRAATSGFSENSSQEFTS